MPDEPDPRFLAGESAVIVDTAQMALSLAVGWDGACDVRCFIDKPQAADILRRIADQWDPPVSLAATLRIAADGRREYDSTPSSASEYLKGEAAGLDSAARLLDDPSTRSDFLQAMLPSWRWPEHGVALDDAPHRTPDTDAPTTPDEAPTGRSES